MARTLFDRPDVVAQQLTDAARNEARKAVAAELAARDAVIDELRRRLARLEKFMAAVAAAGAAQ